MEKVGWVEGGVSNLIVQLSEKYFIYRFWLKVTVMKLLHSFILSNKISIALCKSFCKTITDKVIVASQQRQL